MHWQLSYRADPVAARLADRHHNRQKIGSAQFVPPGRCVVLLTQNEDALWVSSYPFAEYVQHEWAGAWVCSCFRNESQILSSDLIREAIAATRYVWGDPPCFWDEETGRRYSMITFVEYRAVAAENRPPKTLVL